MSDLEKLCIKKKLVVYAVKNGNREPCTWNHPVDAWGITLRYCDRNLSTDFFCGVGNRGKPPSAADVLSCLIGDVYAGEQTFEDFCADLGYNPDSCKAYATWEQRKEMAPKVREFLGDDFDTFANAEH